MMRALRFERFGAADVLHVAEVAEPVPGAGQAKVRVHAASLNPLDWKIRAGHLRFVPAGRPPRGLGCDFAGEIVGTGGGATARHIGERVFGSVSPFARAGAFAEYVVANHDQLATIPDSLDFAEAAALPVAAGTAVQALINVASVAAGQRVLVTGAAGGVGHFAVQVAKHRQAWVAGVCSTRNVDFVRLLGADEVQDYTRQDFTRGDGRFDIVFDAACASSFAAVRQVLAPAGIYISTAGSAGAAIDTALRGVFARLTSTQRAIPFALKGGERLWQRLAEFAAAGALRPHVEREIALEDVPAALESMEAGHGRGKIVALMGVN
ncbi:MAG: NAD(P)-dependent alcohol dehydrogenase [Burkholderiales bacterium]|nr:NAD(P)-dependent alcohol dehydrogenase [Burkholderiales bacterium]